MFTSISNNPFQVIDTISRRVAIGRKRTIAAPPFCFSPAIPDFYPVIPSALLPVIPAKARIHKAANAISAARLTTNN